MAVKTFKTPSEFLSAHSEDVPGCLIVDLKMPEMNGFELWKTLQARGCSHPMIILTGQGSISEAVEAMRLGAVDFIEKPVSRDALLNTVTQACNRDLEQREANSSKHQLERLLDKLSQREREVLDRVIAGQLSKQIAASLDISIKTVEVYRSQIMKKLGYTSIAQLVRMMTEYQASVATKSSSTKSDSARKIPEGHE